MLDQPLQVATTVKARTEANFPNLRLRRLLRTEKLRALARETQVDVKDFIYPLFVVHGSDVREEIASMPGDFHQSLDVLARDIEEISELGIPGILVFGLPAVKDEVGSEDYAGHGIVQEAVRVCKRVNP